MKKALAVFLSILALFGCALPAMAAENVLSVYASNVIPTGSVRMTAHRGYSAVAPENTLPAFRKAGEYGFWGAECDITTTSDGVWVIMHDDTVDRMTNGKGKVSSYTYAKLRKLKINAGNNVDQYPGAKVPSLTEYLDVCKEYGMHAVIEIKESANAKRLSALAKQLSAREEKDMFVIITFSAPFAARMKKLMPEIPVYLLIGGAPGEDFDACVRFCVENKLTGIDFACVWGEDKVKLAQNAGLETMVWTVDDVKTAETYYKMGVRDFTTNALTPGKPQGNLLQRIGWWFKDLFYKIPQFFGGLFTR